MYMYICTCTCTCTYTMYCIMFMYALCYTCTCRSKPSIMLHAALLLHPMENTDYTCACTHTCSCVFCVIVLIHVCHKYHSPSPHIHNTDDMLEHQVSSMGHSAPTNTREPNLNDVVDFLSSSDPTHVANAASYLQHLAYSDDNMKAKIRYTDCTCYCMLGMGNIHVHVSKIMYTGKFYAMSGYII